METRLLIAYALMLVMALAIAGLGFRLWYTARDRSLARQRRQDLRRSQARVAAREAAAPEG